MRHSLFAAAVLGAALISTAASAAVAPPRIPQKHSPNLSQYCSENLDLMSVHKQDVIEVSFEQTIVIRPVCVDSHQDGNAMGLVSIIGRNDAMAAALDEADYSADDVVGIQFGDNVVLLYVME